MRVRSCRFCLPCRSSSGSTRSRLSRRLCSCKARPIPTPRARRPSAGSSCRRALRVRRTPGSGTRLRRGARGMHRRPAECTPARHIPRSRPRPPRRARPAPRARARLRYPRRPRGGRSRCGRPARRGSRSRGRSRSRSRIPGGRVRPHLRPRRGRQLPPRRLRLRPRRRPLRPPRRRPCRRRP